MRYVLNSIRQYHFLNKILFDKDCDEDDMPDLVEGCRYSYFEIHGNCYFLTRSILRDFKEDGLPPNYISSIFQLSSESNFCLEEINADFIDHLLHNFSSDEKDLDHEIFEIHENFVFRYE